MSALAAVDLFAGAGGTTQGLKDIGYTVVAAIEKDDDAAATYAANHPEVRVYKRDIRRVQAPALARRLALPGRLGLLTACPPCQGFSTLGTSAVDDPRNDLIATVARFVRALNPESILLENVPGLATDQRLGRLIAELDAAYSLRSYVVDTADFGVPQRRRRVIIVGINRALGSAPPERLLDELPRDFDRAPITAGEALSAVSKLTQADDPIHRARRSSDLVMRRIKAAPPGGGRADLPPELWLACHERLKEKDATSIYGRIDPDNPAPTMTTRCTTPACGRFIHPTEDRGLTLREAALLQTFPLTYRFHGSHGSIERQVGNAVPVKLAQALGLVIRSLTDAAQGARAA